MAVSSWLCALLAAVTLGGPSAQQHTPGLSVRDGALLKNGVPYRAIGVNYFDAFARTLKDHNDTSYDAGFRVLAENGVPFARFMGTGFWPAEMKLYLEDRARYFELLDGVVRSAEKNGVGLVPSLFWHMPTVPDLVGESCDRWGNPDSKTHEFMRTYTREVVTRYRDSPALWGWEFGNEFNLPADLPNAKEHLPKIAPQLGTPLTRGERDILTHAMIRTAFREFAQEVRKHDRTRMICTGNSIPRPSAWHQMHEGTWTKDSPEQFAEMLAGDNPDPTDTTSVHVYQDAADRLAEAVQAAKRCGKPVFVGEFGVQGEGPEATKQFQSLLRSIEGAQVPLAALWVFDYQGQSEWNVRLDNRRSYHLAAMGEANRRIQQATNAQPDSYRERREQILKRDPKARRVPVIPPQDRQIRVLIDSDARNEIDDIWALALAILSPERLRIEGFVAANFDNNRPEAGLDSIEASRQEIETILQKAGLAGRYPVLRGAPPLRYQYEPSESEGVDFIIEKAMASTPEDPLWVVGLGASTDIASAYLKEPRIAERIVVFWHFRTRWPEKCWNFNVIGDVRAARIVFHSDLAFVLFDTGTHLTCPMSESQQFASCGALGQYLHQYRYESSWYQDPKKGFYDLGDIAALLDPDLASWEVVKCPDVDWDLAYKFNGTKGSILRCYDINRERTFDLLGRKLHTLSQSAEIRNSKSEIRNKSK
jgi:inosine-uridine nucleoside N-ribohydrolase